MKAFRCHTTMRSHFNDKSRRVRLKPHYTYIRAVLPYIVVGIGATHFLFVLKEKKLMLRFASE